MSDAALFSQCDKFGVGVVSLNHEGQCLAACTEASTGNLQPEMAEALAFRRAVYLAREEQFG